MSVIIMIFCTYLFFIIKKYSFKKLQKIKQVPLYCMFVAQMSFNAKVSDPRIGGTYMTMLNTVTNLGGFFFNF